MDSPFRAVGASRGRAGPQARRSLRGLRRRGWRTPRARGIGRGAGGAIAPGRSAVGPCIRPRVRGGRRCWLDPRGGSRDSLRFGECTMSMPRWCRPHFGAGTGCAGTLSSVRHVGPSMGSWDRARFHGRLIDRPRSAVTGVRRIQTRVACTWPGAREAQPPRCFLNQRARRASSIGAPCRSPRTFRRHARVPDAGSTCSRAEDYLRLVSARPPSRAWWAPVIHRARSETRNATSSAASSGAPTKPRGCVCLPRSRKAG